MSYQNASKDVKHPQESVTTTNIPVKPSMSIYIISPCYKTVTSIASIQWRDPSWISVETTWKTWAYITILKWIRTWRCE